MGDGAMLTSLTHLFEQDALSVAASMGFSLAELWIPNYSGNGLSLAMVKANDYLVEQSWSEATRNNVFCEGKGIVGRIHSKKTLEWCEDLSSVDEQLAPRAPVAKALGIISAFGFPGTYGNVNFVVIFLSTKKMKYSSAYVEAGGKMIQKWEISAGDGQLSRSWSDRIEPKVKEVAVASHKNFKKFFSRQILKSLFEGCEIWIEDDAYVYYDESMVNLIIFGGLIWVAECIVMNGLEKWKEGNLGTSFKIGEGLVGRVCQKKSSEGLVEQQLYSTLKFKRAVMAQECGVRTAVAVQARISELGDRFRDMRGVACFISRESITMTKKVFDEVEETVGAWIAAVVILYSDIL
eukprot:jgi/Bigna1/132754/aug1.18_g7462